MDSSPDLSIQLRRNSRDSRETFYMDFAQGIDSDIEEVSAKSVTTTHNNPNNESVTTTTSTVVTETKLSGAHSDTLELSSSGTTMDPPSPILPPPPGSISPPRFLNEDFDIEDEESASLPSNLNAAELLIEPPPPPMTKTTGGSRSNTVEEESADEGEDDDEDQQTIIQNKLKSRSIDDESLRIGSGLDSLTSDMAAKLQSMISEEIEETIPKDAEDTEWTSTISSPAIPAWRNEETRTTTTTTVVVTTTGSVEEDEEDDESSGNSQSPKQVHNVISPPPPPQEEEEDPEDISIPEKCTSPVPAVEDEVNNNPRDDEEPISLPSVSSASLPPPAPLSLDATSDIVPPPSCLASAALEELIQSPPPPPLASETAEERELLRKLMDDNDDAELLRQFSQGDDVKEEMDEDLPLPGRMCGLARELQSPPAPVAEKRESLLMERDYTKEEEDEEDVHVQEALPKYSEKEEEEEDEGEPVSPVKKQSSLRDSVISQEKDDSKLEEESEPEDDEFQSAPPPKIQEMIPKTISIPEKIQSPIKEVVSSPEKVQEVKPPSPVKAASPPPEPQPTVAPVKLDEPRAEPVKPMEPPKEEPTITKIASPKGTRLDDFRKPYIPAYSSSLTSNKPPSYTSTVYTQPGAITALNDRNRPVYVADDRRQRYSSPSSSLREQFFSASSTSTTNTSSGAPSTGPQKPPMTQTSVCGGSAGGMASEEQKSASRVEETSISKSEVNRQTSSQQQQQQIKVTTQQQQISSSSSSQQQRTSRTEGNRQSGQSQSQQMSSRRSQEMSEGATSRGGSGSGGNKQPSTPGSTGGDLEKGLVVAATGDGADPAGRLPDVSSLVKLAQDIECQSTCSLVKAGDACSLAFSAIYSKLIIVLGISLPLVEVISPHHIPVLAYQGFYLYLYGVGILFLLFMFFSLCCCGGKAPASISPSTSATSQSETSKASASKSKKGKADDSPQTPQEELKKRMEELAAAAAAASANQDANGAGSDLNAATSTTNILTASPTAGGGAVTGAPAESKERKPSRKISYAFSDVGKARYHYGSYFLRFGAIVFGLASIFYSGLEFGQYFECKHLILTLTPGVRTLFILLQLYFIFLNNEKITLYPFKLIARVGLMHLIGTNLALWINVLIHETNNEFSYSGQVQNLTVWTTEAFSGEVKWNMSGWNFQWQEMMADCPRTNLLGKLMQMASPYLFPCCIQYALICSIILYFMWRNVGRYPATPIGVLQHHSSISCSFRVVDCRQSYKGLFLGVLILASTIASVAAFFVLLNKDTFEKLAFTQLTLCELALYGITMLAILIGSIRMRRLAYDGVRRFHLDEYLLIGTQIGLFLYSTLAILGTEFNLEPETIFTWVTAILSILQTVCQTMFILDGSRRTAGSIDQSRERPGREFVVFLLIANLALWIMSVFQKSRPGTNPVPLQFYGLWTWTVITHLWSPLAIFYRFHSTVCLIEISKRAYKIKPTFM